VIRRKLVACILSRVDWATHELPTGYIGEPSEGLTALDEAERLTGGLNSEQDRAEFDAELREQRKMILSYINTRIGGLPPTSPD
jgi:hypothetical protein